MNTVSNWPSVPWTHVQLILKDHHPHTFQRRRKSTKPMKNSNWSFCDDRIRSVFILVLEPMSEHSLINPTLKRTSWSFLDCNSQMFYSFAFVKYEGGREHRWVWREPSSSQLLQNNWSVSIFFWHSPCQMNLWSRLLSSIILLMRRNFHL